MQLKGTGRTESVLGPLRIFPGRLSVSRSFGDNAAKDPEKGGNPNVLIAEPQIRVTRFERDMEYIIIASDGIFDKLMNREVAA
jgi:protein phosphatase 2C family protein 2/3